MSQFDSLRKSLKKTPGPKVNIEDHVTTNTKGWPQRERFQNEMINMEVSHPTSGKGVSFTVERDSRNPGHGKISDFGASDMDQEGVPDRNIFTPGMLRDVARHLTAVHGIDSVSYAGRRGAKQTDIAGDHYRAEARNAKRTGRPMQTPLDAIHDDRRISAAMDRDDERLSQYYRSSRR